MLGKFLELNIIRFAYLAISIAFLHVISPYACFADDTSFGNLDLGTDSRPLTKDPPPKIPRPPAPPEDSRFSIDLRSAGEGIPSAAPVSKEVKLGTIPVLKLPPLQGAAGPLPPIRLEATFVERITLSDVLTMALENNLPIRMARAEYNSRKFRVLASVGEMLPNVATGFTQSRTWSGGTHADSAPSFYNVVYLPVFNGGEDMFRLLRSVHEKNASRFANSATINDTLLDVYYKYQDLILQQALLQVRIKAVDTSKLQLQQNEDRKSAGEGTSFEVLQSRTRLAQDRQLLLRQQVAYRQAALRLAVSINMNPSINLLPEDSRISPSLLVDPRLSVLGHIGQAIDRRPELKENEQLRIAAKRHVQQELGSLYPNAKFFLATNVTGSGGSSSNGAGGIIIPAGGSLAGGLISTGSPSNGSNAAFTGGFTLNWVLRGLGVVDAGNALALREQARKVAFKSNEVLLHVLEEVRSSYLETLTSKEEISVAYEGVESASEELRVADMRLKYSVGTNLELLSAQKDYFEALARQAEAIINYRKSQARLLRDTGTISINALTADLRPLKYPR